MKKPAQSRVARKWIRCPRCRTLYQPLCAWSRCPECRAFNSGIVEYREVKRDA